MVSPEGSVTVAVPRLASAASASRHDQSFLKCGRIVLGADAFQVAAGRMALVTPAGPVEVLLAGLGIAHQDLRDVHVAAPRGINHARMQVSGDIGDLTVRRLDLDDFGMLRRSHKLRELDAVFVMQRDHRRNQVGTGLAALASLPVAVTAGGIVCGKATRDRLLWIDLESRTSGATAAAASTAPARRAWRRLGDRRLSFDDGHHSEEGKPPRKSE